MILRNTYLYKIHTENTFISESALDYRAERVYIFSAYFKEYDNVREIAHILGIMT